MQLRQIGELRLLKEIRKKFSLSSRARSSGVIVGIGDDAAVIAPPKGKLIVTTDMMDEGVHFDLGYTSPFNLGFKLVSVNISDIMAMGGRPGYLFLNIAVKRDTDRDFFRKLYDGISVAMDLYGVKLLGGDLSSAKNDMVLSAMVIGFGNKAVTRAGAKAGDRIYVTGTVGDSACGLEILRRLTPASRKRIRNSEFRIQNSGYKSGRDLSIAHNSKRMTVKWDTAAPLIKRHLAPVARDSGRLVEHATSMIDISDGLFIDLCRVCDESNVGAKIYLDKIPVSAEMRNAAESIGIDPIALATAGGEDYELLFTAPGASRVTRRASHVKVTCIGEITKKDRIIVDKTGRASAMKAKGYQHFGTSR